jgi:hypothetical protein
MKNWNNDGKPHEIQELLEPLEKGVFDYLQNGVVDTDSMYALGLQEAVSSCQPEEVFSEEYMRWKREDSDEGRYSIVGEALYIAFMYGMEQERRLAAQGYRSYAVKERE